MGHIYHTRIRVRHYELDSLGHVNNAVYLQWAEQAIFDACAVAGFPAERMLEEFGLTFVARRSEIDYHQPAFNGDEIEISSWVNTLARTHGTWVHDIHRRADKTLMVRVHSTGAFVNPQGRPIRLPEVLYKAVVEGG